MLRALNIPEWFSELCRKFIDHFGQPEPEPVLTFHEIYRKPGAEQDDMPFSLQESIGGDVMLDDTIPLTKHKLVMSILGFFNLGLEFNPEVLCEFIAGLG